MLCYEILTTTSTSNSFINSRAQHRQAGAIPFYSYDSELQVGGGTYRVIGTIGSYQWAMHTDFFEVSGDK